MPHARVVRALAILIAAAAVPFAAAAADLPQPLVVAPPVILEDGGSLCVIKGPGGSVEVYEEPRGEVWGNLPNGMLVEVMDAPYSDRTDLWVRIKPPRLNNYYGWVETSTFICV